MLPVLDGSGPLHHQLYRWLRQSILHGHLGPGERLPASRVLARTQSLSRNTVLRAYERLVAEGYAQTQPGAGTFVARAVRAQPVAGESQAAAAPAQLTPLATRALQAVPARYVASGLERGREAPNDIDFQYGQPLGDAATWRAWRRSVAQRTGDMPQHYPPAQGLLRLRLVIADFLWRRRGMRVDAAQILIVNGSQQALDLAARVLLPAGERALVENPGYPGARAVFQAAGARLLPMPVDAAGLRTEALPPARLTYVTPSHQFPTGGLLPLERRLQLLAWARANQAFVVEDDYDSDYVFLPRPLEAVQALDLADRVIYVATFAKVLTPALRLGYMVLPRSLVEAMVSVKCLSDRGCALVEQAAMADFIENGHLDRHIRRTVQHLRRRRDALVAALSDTFGERVRVAGTHAGMHLVAWFPELDPARIAGLCKMAARHGVRIYPLTPYCHGKASHSAGVLLGYATLSREQIAAGVAQLGSAYARCA